MRILPVKKNAGVRRYGRLLRYAIPHWRGFTLIVTVTLLSTAFSLLQPWPMKILVDHVLGQKQMSQTLAGIVSLLPGADTAGGLLVWIVLASLGVFAVNSAIDAILTLSWIRVGQQMAYDLARDMFAHLQRLSLRFHSRNSVGDSISRITSDSSCVNTIVSALLFTPVNALIAIIGMVIVMARMDQGLTLLSLTVAPLMAGASFVFGRRIRATARTRRKVESRIQSHVQQILRSIPIVQAYAREDQEHRRFQELADAIIRAQQRNTLAGGVFSLSSGLITTLGTAVILWIGAHRVLQGQLTVGSILVFLSYLGSLQGQMKALTGVYGSLQGAGASVDRVMEVLETEQEVKDRPGARPLPAISGHVRLEEVSFGYEPQRPVLRQVSLEALPGQTIALVGPTGVGKSTLVSLILRFFDPWSGRVLIDEHDLRDVQLKSLRNQIAVVMQEPFLFPLTVAENIAYGHPEASPQEIERAARAANAHGFIERLAEGYQTVVGERGATLSGGERQRLSIARALLKDAPVLILDEPTSALDAETEWQLLEAVGRLMVGRTTFIIAHRLSTIRRADKIVFVQEGQVAELGTHAELLAQGGLYQRFHSIQFGEQDRTFRVVE